MKLRWIDHNWRVHLIEPSDSSANPARHWARAVCLALLLAGGPGPAMAAPDDHPLFAIDCLADGDYDGADRLELLERWRDEALAESPVFRGQWLYCRATALEKTGDLDAAYASYSEAIEAYAQLPEPVIGAIRTRLDRSYVDYLRTNDPDRYCPDRAEALRLARRLGDPEAQLAALNQYAFCFAQEPEQLAEGLGLLEEALALAQAERMSAGQLGMIYNATANLYRRNQLLEPARTHLELAYRAWQDEDDRQDMFNMLHGLIQVSVRLGQWADAERYIEQMRALTERSPQFADFPFFIAFNAGTLAAARGQHGEAIRALDEALALEHTTQERYFVAAAHRMRALSEFRVGNLELAAEHARAFIDSVDVERGDPDLLAAEAIGAFAAGEALDAVQMLLDVLDAERAQTREQLRRNTAGQAAIHDRRLEDFQSAILREQLDNQQLQLAQAQQAERNARLFNALIGVTAAALLVLAGFLFWSRQRFRIHARTDALTGIANRRHAMALAERQFDATRSSGRAYGLLVLDLDRFKQINDRHGHDAGDRALKSATERVAGVLPDGAIFGRMGGEEFLVALPGRDQDAALAVAESIRLAIGATPIDVEGSSIALTASIGVAVRPDGATAPASLDVLYREADRALYSAKDLGRDRVLLAG